MIKIESLNLNEAYHHLVQLFTRELSSLYFKPSYNSFRNDHYLNLFAVHLQVDSHKNMMTLEELGYTKRKVNHLLKTYLDPSQVHEWVAKLRDTTERYERVDSDVSMRTTDNSKHGNGPCLLGFSYRSHRVPELTVYSRSVELPQTYGADTILVSALAQYIYEELGLEQPIRINWYIASARLRSRSANFYSLMMHPFNLTWNHPEFHKHVKKQWDNILADQEKKVSFSKLVKLQEEYRRVVINNEEPKESTGTGAFVATLRSGGWKV